MKFESVKDRELGVKELYPVLVDIFNVRDMIPVFIGNLLVDVLKECDAEKEDECDERTWDEIEQCLRSNAPSGWPTWDNSCGHKFRNSFKKCGLKDPTPWWLYYP